MAEKVDETEDFGDEPDAPVRRWLAEIKAYDEAFGPWMTRVDDIVKRYRDERPNESRGMRFNILWSNIQTMKSIVPGGLLEPNVTRRYKDRDPVGLCAALVLERCMGHTIDSGETAYNIALARDDYLLGGRGQAWVRYVPMFGEERPAKNYVNLQANDDQTVSYRDDAGEEISEENVKFDEGGHPYTEGDPYKPLVHEETVVDYISWRDFGHTPAPTWDKVRAVWRRELMTREQLVERFTKKLEDGGTIGEKVRLTKNATGVSDDEATKYGDVFKRGEVFEIWDRVARKVCWVSPGYNDGLLDSQEDQLNLVDFFPCPRPAYATMTGNQLVPVPDYAEYQDQARELDVLTARIHLLLKAMKVSGAYDGSFRELENIIKGEENILVPVDEWAMFQEKGGLKGAIAFTPIAEIAQALTALMQMRKDLKRDIFEITGISDIVRGQGEGGRKTAKEQQIKGQFATMRLNDRQDELKRFARDVMRIVAEIVAEQFSPETMYLMSGWSWTIMARELNERSQQDPNVPNADAVFAEAVELLRSDKMRSFRIDIETTGTALDDAVGEKQSRVELIQALGQFMGQALPAGEKYPEIGGALAETMLFGIRAFKQGRHLETSFEHAIEDMRRKPPQQDPEQQAAAMQAQVEQAKVQAEQQKMEAEAKQTILDAQVAEKQSQMDLVKLDREAEADALEHQYKMEEIEAKHSATMRELASKAAVADIDAQSAHESGSA